MKRLVPFALACMTATRLAAADAPWETGVPTETRDQANALFAAGNELFARQAHQPALEKYKEAIALWDHPLIRFNMAVTLIRLDRLLDAAETIEAALRYGDKPYSAEHYQQALDYQKLVGTSVGYVEASCEQSGVQVLLDGKPWFQCPATNKVRVLAGEHVVVGEKPEFATASKRVVVAGNATATAKLELRSFESVVKLEYPSPRWLPWSVAGAGAAIALGGVGFYFAGRNQMDKFEAQFATECPNGCRADLSDNVPLREQRDSAELKGKIAISMMIAGGAVTAGGVVWAILNRPRRILPNVEVAPTAGGAAASVGWLW